MKLNFFINTLAGGGAEKVLVDLVNLLPQETYKITVTTLLHGIHENRLAPNVRHYCIINTRNRILSFVLERIYCKLIPHKLFSRLFLRGEYDVIISYLEGFNTQILAAYQGQSKRIAFVHCNTGVDSAWTKSYNTLEDCLQQYASFDRVCFISQDALDGFESVIGHLPNSCVVHNVINLDAVLAMSKGTVLLSQINNAMGIRLITVGRLTRIKGFERLLNALARLRDDNLHCVLFICGEGDARPELEKQVVDLKLRDVHFLGFQTNPYQYMAQADFYVCSSYSEGYSTSVVESIALGIPVITTNCSGMHEILCYGEYGDIVENSDDGLYWGLKRVLSDPDHRAELKSKVMIRARELKEMNPLKEYMDLFDNV